MNKIKDVIKKYKSNNISDKKKIENLIFFLIMLVILVIGMNSIFFNNKSNSKKDTLKNSSTLSEQKVSDNILVENNIEDKLEKMLAKVKGVTNVSVMVTYESDKQIVPIYNLEEKEVVTKETDSTGGIRDTTQKDYSKQVIFENEGNSSNIVVEKEVKPKIAGVLVVANYNNDMTLKQKIITAVATASNINEYRVQVLSSN